MHPLAQDFLPAACKELTEIDMICASVNLGAELSYKAGGGDEHQKVRASLHLLLRMTFLSEQTCSSAQTVRRSQGCAGGQCMCPLGLRAA